MVESINIIKTGNTELRSSHEGAKSIAHRVFQEVVFNAEVCENTRYQTALIEGKKAT